jgi:RNA polymerase sigma-70 factor (ECF subfamily)
MADDAGFDAFYLTTRNRLLGQLTLLTNDRELAQDVLQEAYVKAWQRWGRVSRLEDPAAWVRTVAWRESISRWRRSRVAWRARHRTAEQDVAADPMIEQAMDVRSALAALPEGQRLVLVLHEMCDLTVDQVAAQTGLAPGTVKTRLMRGRAALAELLAPGEQEVRDARPA